MRVNHLWCKNSSLELLSGSSYNFRRLRLEILSTVLRRIEIRASSSLSSSGNILLLQSSPFFFPSRKAIALTCRRGNWTVRTSRAVGVIEKTSREIGKEFLSPIRFFFQNHWSIRVNYDRKKYTRLFRQASFAFFVNKYFWICVNM